VSFDGASQSLLHFRHGDDVAVEVETQTARATRDQIVRGLDEIRARADGTEHVVVARGEIIVHDGAQLGLFVGATSLVFSQDQFLFRHEIRLHVLHHFEKFLLVEVPPAPTIRRSTFHQQIPLLAHHVAQILILVRYLHIHRFVAVVVILI